MKDSVMLSIILPAYNHELYIGKAIESILTQSYKDFEVIIIDDGSSDGTWNVIKQYAAKDQRIRAFQQKNMGTSKTQEIALSRASGKWVTFCGSDDSFPPGAFQAFMDKAESNDLVIGAHYCCDDFGERKLIKVPRTNNLIKQLYFTGALWGKLFRKDFLLENNISVPELLLEEDTVFLSELALSKPQYSLISVPVYEYWNHNLGGQSLTRRTNKLLFEHRLKGKSMALDNLATAGFRDEWEHYFIMYSQQLSRYLLMMYEEDGEDSFSFFKEFVFKHDWNSNEGLFKSIYHCTPEEFKKTDYSKYRSMIFQMEPGDYLLDMFGAGLMGCKYIIKFALAWAGFKIRRIRSKWKF